MRNASFSICQCLRSCASERHLQTGIRDATDIHPLVRGTRRKDEKRKVADRTICEVGALVWTVYEMATHRRSGAEYKYWTYYRDRPTTWPRSVRDQRDYAKSSFRR